MSSAGLQSWRLAYEISPIVLVGGIAGGASGGIPIVNFTDPGLFEGGILNSANPDAAPTLDDYFAHFTVMAQGDLVNIKYGKYPFANQQVAANAAIFQPLTISVRMTCPMKGPGAAASKLSVITALQSTLNNHVNAGGTFTLMTPFFPYTNLLLNRLYDVSSAETKQKQWDWQWDFEQPLLTTQQAQQAYGSLINRMQAQGMIAEDPPAWSGPQSVADNFAAGGTPAAVPSGQNLPAAGTAAPQANQPTQLPFNIGAP